MDWSYIAGFFDGEGNFHIIFTKKSLHLVCRIYGNSVAVFNEMINFMGFGKTYITQGRVPELIINKKEEVKIFLERISPFLILKKDHALFLLKEYNFTRNNNLDFNIDKFHEYSHRKGKEKFYNPSRKSQIEELKSQLSKNKVDKPLTD
jgi:hypothetical protein